MPHMIIPGRCRPSSIGKRAGPPVPFEKKSAKPTGAFRCTRDQQIKCPHNQ